MNRKTQSVSRMNSKVELMEETDVAYLAGVFDAIGTIAVQVRKDSDYKLNYTLEPYLRLRRHDEEDLLLGVLAEYCDEHGVQYIISGTDREKKVEWLVRDRGSVNRFLEPLMEYLVTNYFEAHLMVGKVLPALEDGVHLEEEGFYQLMELVEELRSERPRREIKYDQEFFSEKWSLAK